MTGLADFYKNTNVNQIANNTRLNDLQVKSARRDNRLAELLEPIQSRKIEIQGQQQEIDENVQGLAAVNVGLGADFEQLAPELQQQRFKDAVQMAGSIGFDVSDAPEQLTPELLQHLRHAGQKVGLSPSKFQFGASNLIRTDKGIQIVTQRRNPQSGEVETVASPVQGTLVNDLGLSAQDKVAQAGAETRAKEQAKVGVEIESATARGNAEAEIKQRIAQVESEARANGETATELRKAKAALPSLTKTIDQLRELAPLATNTLAGKFFDSASKELGFGATEGATARAKFIATIDNQVLPLLKQTFGAAFTAQEGEALRKTMGDPDATPDEKLAQLDAFIQQKMNDIETKERELGVQNPNQQISVEDLINQYAD